MSDAYESDVDSTLGEDITDNTESLSPSVFDYQFENGRRYHAYEAGRYFMPNDDQEQEVNLLPEGFPAAVDFI